MCKETFLIKALCTFLQRGVFVDDLTERSCHDSKQLFDVFNDGEGIAALCQLRMYIF